MKRKIVLTLLTLSLITSNTIGVNALTDTSKQNINKAINGYKTSITLPLSTNKQQLMDFLKNVKAYNLNSVNVEATKSGLNVNLKYFETAEEMKAVDRLASIIHFETKNMSPNEKVYYIVQRINGILDYAKNSSEPHIFSPTGIKKGEAVCQGYARLASIIFSKSGIPNTFVEGSFSGSNVPHLWNAVNLYNEWFYVDVTQSDMDNGLTDFNYVLMNNKQLKNNGYKVSSTRVIGSDSDIQYFKGQGLISVLNKRFYSKMVGEKDSIIGYSYLNKSLEFVANSSNFWVAGGELFTLKGNNLTNMNNGEIYYSYLDEVDSIKEIDGGLYVNDSIIYNSTNLPLDMVNLVYSDFKISVSDLAERKNFYIEELANKTNVYYKNEFLVQYLRK